MQQSTEQTKKKAADDMVEALKKDIMKKSIREEDSEMQDLPMEDVSMSVDDPEPDLDSQPTPRTWGTAMLEIRQLKEENKRLREENLIMKGELLDAARELPGVVRKLKKVLHGTASTTNHPSTPMLPASRPATSDVPALQGTPPRPPSEGLESEMTVDLVPGSGVRVPKYKLSALRTSTPATYIRDLAVLVFGKKVLSESSLTGKQSGAHKDVESKRPLDEKKLEVIIGHVRSKYPNTTVQEVRRVIRKKINNISYNSKKN
ncbi:BEN domain-containing protein 6-like [Chaetodon trifascialis]|uniref:BEN domain-containing protein 6-like n=1 Tax=Chaetodon trifascialis TaxID=109706 RepID=UPI0039918804